MKVKTPAQLKWDALEAKINETYTEMRAMLSELPEIPADGECDCGESDLRIETLGYSQWCSLTLEVDDNDETVWFATTDGWDDMSEDGRVESVFCMNCMANYREPDDINWN